MITDIPTPEDFERSGKHFLHTGWEKANELLDSVDSFANKSEESPSDITGYWAAVQSQLSMSLALVQQGIEQLLKARVADVSPFLLIVANPRDWPQGSQKGDIAFADFRTIDAQDLIRVHDTVVPSKLSERFKQRFDHMRRLRNSIFHTIDKRITVAASQILEATLEGCATLLPGQSWPAIRREHLAAEPVFALVPDEDNAVTYLMNRELETVVKSLSPAFVKEYLAFDTKQRRYLCYPCTVERPKWGDDDTRLALLQPNTAKSSALYCIACDRAFEVRRVACTNPDCKGNVIETEGNTCCSCGEVQDHVSK